MAFSPPDTDEIVKSSWNPPDEDEIIKPAWTPPEQDEIVSSAPDPAEQDARFAQGFESMRSLSTKMRAGEDTPETRQRIENISNRAMEQPLPVQAPIQSLGTALKPLPLASGAIELGGNIARSAVADTAALAGGYPEYSGNLKALFHGEGLPVDEALKLASVDEPAKAVLGKISQGLAATAPMLGIAALPKLAQKTILAGFTAKMMADVPEVATQLGDELGKPKEEQDPDKITSLISQGIQSVGFSALGTAGLFGGEVGKVATAKLPQPISEPLTRPRSILNPTGIIRVEPERFSDINKSVNDALSKLATPENAALLPEAAKAVTETATEIPKAVEAIKAEEIKPTKTPATPTPRDPTLHLDYTPEDLVKYQELKPKTVPKTVEEYSSPEFQANWKEFETLRNKYNGNPPKQLLESSAPKPSEAVAPSQLPKQTATGAVSESAQPAGEAAIGEIPKWTKATESPILDAVKESLPEPQPLGFAPPGTAAIQKAITAVKNVAKAAVALPKATDLRRSILDWSGKLQGSFGEIREAQKAIKSISKTPVRREAIVNWIEAGGDVSKLQTWEAGSKNAKRIEGYRAAQNLTPEELTLAKEIKTAFDALHARGVKYDMLDSFRDNYVNHIWNRGILNRLTGGGRRLNDKLRFSKARTFENFFEGEQAGFEPSTKDISQLLPIYIHEMNNAIAAKQLVENLSKGVGSDGRPLVAPRGNAKLVDNDGNKAILVFPKAIKDADTLDYKTLESQPALHDWRWVGKDENGNPVMLKSDLALHPEAYNYLKQILGQSEIRRWYNSTTTPLAEVPKLVVKGIDAAQSEMKKSMLGLLAPFHQVQEGTHAVGHKVNPFFSIPEIDLQRNPAQLDAAKHGLMLYPDRISENVFREGLGQTGYLIRKIPVLGKLSELYSDYLFHDYIPGLKYKTYEHILERNLARYKDEIASGKAAESDIKILSSEQTNAAFGHLNYADLARNPTIQHLLQLSLLAPDFLEARGRFAAQAAKGFTGSKVGREQLAAVAVLALAQFTTSRIINKLADDDWHFDHPFEVVVGGRRYALRSVPEDIFNLLKDSRQFWYGRLNPLVGKGIIQGYSGVNYRGEKVTGLETAEELLAQYIPITARWIPGVKALTQTSRARSVSPLEELSGALGLRISRYSPISDAYKLAGEWNEQKGLPKDRGSYPISKYQQLRYALEDGDIKRARDEFETLKKDGMVSGKIFDGFRESLFHPFTGTLKSDQEFAGSLKGKDKEIYDLAVKKRKDIWNRFTGIYNKPASSSNNLNIPRPPSIPRFRP